MSGFAAVFSRDDAPIDAAILDSMTAAIAGRGPDRRDVRVVAGAGFGHTLLRTTNESRDEQQPWTVDGREWIVADARVDARSDLIRALEGRGVSGLIDRPDVELILHAYRTWGEACVDHLLGDFAFAVWDTANRRVFAARDQLGGKPFFYAAAGSQLVLSNSLDCIRRHPAVSSTLNEIAIADFLVRGANQDAATTTFADIGRLKPAHRLLWRNGALDIRRYWTLPVQERIRYRRRQDYVVHFQDVLGTAVADRLRMDRSAIVMSGGIDSTSVALAARRRAPQCDLQSYTQVLDRRLPHQERRYATIAAQALGIPIHYFVADDYQPFAHWDDETCRTPEPSRHVFLAIDRALQRDICSRSRIVLTGYGGDPLFNYRTDVAGLLKQGRLLAIASDVLSALVLHRRLPPVGIRSTIRALLPRAQAPAALPDWLDADFVRRLDLVERYRTLAPEPVEPVHPIRYEAHRMMMAQTWPRLFELTDASFTGMPLEFRHPFFDLRVIKYVFAIPPIPWSLNKELMRSAMIGGLPDAIRVRRKTPLSGDLLSAWCANEAARRRLEGLVRTPHAQCCRRAFPPNLEPGADLWANVRPISLECWLRTSNLSIG